MKFWVECLVTCLRVLWYRLWLLRPIIFIRSWKMFLKKFPFPFWTIWHKYGQRLTTNKWPDGQKMIKTKKGHWQHGQKKLSGNFFVRTKGHLPPSMILPKFLLPWLTNPFLKLRQGFTVDQLHLTTNLSKTYWWIVKNHSRLLLTLSNTQDGTNRIISENKI